MVLGGPRAPPRYFLKREAARLIVCRLAFVIYPLSCLRNCGVGGRHAVLADQVRGGETFGAIFEEVFLAQFQAGVDLDAIVVRGALATLNEGLEISGIEFDLQRTEGLLGVGESNFERGFVL